MSMNRKASRNGTRAGACPVGTASRSAFTLIEVLVVIVILGVLVALVVGVGKVVTDKAARDSTSSIQTILTSAINVFHQATGEYPVEDANSPAASNRKLWEQLTAVPESYKLVQRLPADAVSTSEQMFRDGYGRNMDYRKSGGMGGQPVIISPGPDGKFSKPHEVDNIRSDGKGQ